MANPDRLKEHARVRLMDYWVMCDGEKIQLPLQEDGYVGHFGEVINFALKRALRELNFPWLYDVGTDRISIKYYSGIKESVCFNFAIITHDKDIKQNDIVEFAIYGERENEKYIGFRCFNEHDVTDHDGLEFICYICVKIV